MKVNNPTPLPDFAALRAEFPVTRELVYLNLANRAPLPKCSQDAVGDFLRDMNEQGAQEAYSKARIEEARASVARLSGVSPETIAFVKNTSEGLNIAAQSLNVQAGDNVIQTDLDHLNQVYAWKRLEERGVELRWVHSQDGRLPIDAFIEQMDDKTRVVAVSYVSCRNGCRVDVPALAEVCRNRGIRLVVDTIQGTGVLAAPLSKLGADVVVCGGHKGMLGLAGTGFLYCRKELIPSLYPPYVAQASMRPESVARREIGLAPDAHRFEIGNFNYLGLWVLGRSAEFLASIGLEHIEQRVRSLTTYLIKLLDQRGKKTLTPRAWEERAGIVSIQVDDPQGMTAFLRKNGIIVSAPYGVLRVSPHFYNTEEELEKLLRLL